MLILPENPEPIRAVGIDPGTTHLGLSMVSWDFEQREYTVEQARTLIGKNNASAYKFITELHGHRVSRLRQIRMKVVDQLKSLDPHVVITETPFVGKSVKSYGALVECIAAVRDAVFEYDPYLPFIYVSPIEVKKTLGVKLGGKSDKNDMKNALLRRKDLHWRVDAQELDEHETDSIAVALHFYQELL